VIEALDLAPVLDEHLLKLGKWIADYYLAPVGEVFRTMLPLSAEFKRSVAYRITDAGRMALHLAGMSGSPARSKRTPEQQLVEFRVLDFLAERDDVREGICASDAGGQGAAGGMVRKKWIAREDVSAARDAARFVKVAVLRRPRRKRGFDSAGPSTSLRAGSRDARPSTNTATKLNDNQRILIETLAPPAGACG